MSAELQLRHCRASIRTSVSVCLAAIAVVQKRPLLKAALFATGIDDFARVALLRTYQKDDRLLVTVDRIGRQIENRRHASTSNTIERTWSSSRI